jgi:flagellar motility protein MotE (MotC chaperone)
MKKERKDLENKIEANYQKYTALRDKLRNELPLASNLLFELTDVYHELSKLRFAAGIAMVKDVYELDK